MPERTMILLMQAFIACNSQSADTKIQGDVYNDRRAVPPSHLIGVDAGLTRASDGTQPGPAGPALSPPSLSKDVASAERPSHRQTGGEDVQ